jgi:hypothetical protein
MHTFLGRFRVGDSVPIVLATIRADGTIGTPTAPPQVRIVPLGPGAPGFSWTFPLPLWQAPNLFRSAFLITASAPPYGRLPRGRYTVRLTWQDNGQVRMETASFDVGDLGDDGGGVIALHQVRRGARSTVVAQLSSGVLVAGSNPRL